MDKIISSSFLRKSTNFAKMYFFGAGTIGFHRGYCNHYSDQSLLQHRKDYEYILNKNLYKLSNYDMERQKNNEFSHLNETDLITDKIIYGFISSVYYLNPIFHILILYSSAKRMEKRLRNIPMNKYDWVH